MKFILFCKSNLSVLQLQKCITNIDDPKYKNDFMFVSYSDEIIINFVVTKEKVMIQSIPNPSKKILFLNIKRRDSFYCLLFR